MNTPNSQGVSVADLFQKYSSRRFVTTTEDLGNLISDPDAAKQRLRELSSRGCDFEDLRVFSDDLREMRMLFFRNAEAQEIREAQGAPAAPGAPTPAAKPKPTGSLLVSDDPAPLNDQELLDAQILINLISDLIPPNWPLLPSPAGYQYESVYPEQRGTADNPSPVQVQEEILQRWIIPLMHAVGIVAVVTTPVVLMPDGSVQALDPESPQRAQELQAWRRTQMFYQMFSAGKAQIKE